VQRMKVASAICFQNSVVTIAMSLELLKNECHDNHPHLVSQSNVQHAPLNVWKLPV